MTNDSRDALAADVWERLAAYRTGPKGSILVVQEHQFRAALAAALEAQADANNPAV